MSLHDQSQDEKRSKKKRRRETCQLVVTASRMETQEEKRLFFFKWRQQEQLCTVSSIYCWEPPGEERLNGWVQGWDRGLLYGLGVGLRTPLCSGSCFWAGGAGCRLGCSFLGKEKEGGRACTTGHVQRPGRVMPHTHTYTQGCAHNHYLKRVCQPPR